METETISNTTGNNEKILKVLYKILEPNFKIKNNVALSAFLNHLVAKNDGSKPAQKLKKINLNDEFCEWIIQASDSWERNKVSPPAAVLSFTLNLAGQLSADQQIFVRLNDLHVFENLVGVTQSNFIEDCNLTLGFITMLSSFLEHESGVQWVMAKNYWIHMINLGLCADTLYIRKKAYQFVTKLLEQTVQFNRNFAVCVANILVKPLKDVLRSYPAVEDGINPLIENENLYELLKPSLDFISDVVETLLKKFNKDALHLFREIETQETIELILILSDSDDFSFDLLRIQFVFLFHEMCAKSDGVKLLAHDSLTLNDIKLMFDLIKNEMDRQNVRCVAKICIYANDLYCSLIPRLPLCVRKGETIEFENQMLIFQIFPLLVVNQHLLSIRTCRERLFADVIRLDFTLKLLRKAAIKSMELCMRYASKLRLKQDLIEDAIYSLQYMMKAKKALDKERASIVFSPLVFFLKDAIFFLTESPHVQWTSRTILYISTLVDSIVDFVESFDLTWKDSMQTISVMELACKLLEHPDWPSKIIVQGLKLLKTAISKYMSPDMVLLIYNTKDAIVSQTGNLVRAKCHDDSWDIRNGALEVIYTLSLNANTKFPALTNVLIDAELPQLVVNMALKDDQFNVRATAFKCLQELIQITEIWNTFLSVDNFLENILNVFENETEGIVRKEAATLMYKVAKFQEYPQKILPRLYDVMTYVALEDSYWEAKYNALDFWFNSWDEHLTQQGMIDKKFPSHTFSMENRKIVALNELEVRKRIIKVLNQLSHTGCLYVFKRAVQNHSDVEVSKKATDFAVQTLELFRTYKVPSENIDLSPPTSPWMQQSDNSKEPIFEPVSPVSPPAVPASLENSPQISSKSIDLNEVMSPDDFLNLKIIEPVTPENVSMIPDFCTENFLNLGSQQLTDFEFSDSFSPYPNIFNRSLNLGLITPPSTSQNRPLKNDSTTSSPATDAIVKTAQLQNVINNPTQLKTRVYLAPSDYLKFVYNEIHTATEKNTLSDEFECLLDDILKEYNIATEVNYLEWCEDL